MGRGPLAAAEARRRRRRSARGSSGRDGGRRRNHQRPSEDRPYVLILLALLVVIGAMAVGPVRSLGDANERVDQLTEERDVLAADVDRLEAERQALHDPAEQEVYAREQLGLVRPGDEAYVVLPEEDDNDPLDGGEAAGTGDESADDRRPWYRRIGDALASLFGG